MKFLKWVQSLFGYTSSTLQSHSRRVPTDNIAHAKVQSIQLRLTADAFGGGGFNSESDLDRSQILQRERRKRRGMVDFTNPRDDVSTACINLLGGPYDGQKALVVAGTNRAWVIGNWEYFRIGNSDNWHWCHDNEA